MNAVVIADSSIMPELAPLKFGVVEHNDCRICGGALTELLSLGEQYPSEFVDSPGKMSNPKVPLTLMLCKAGDCGLVQLKHTTPREWLYSEYWYRSGTNEAMVRALSDITDRARELVPLEEWDWVMDIGANDGTLLKSYNAPLYASRGKPGMMEFIQPLAAARPQRIAFDPAQNLQAELAQSCEIVVPDFFPSLKYDGPQPRVITSIAMFYDLEDPNGFVAEIKRILHPDGVWIIQLGDLASMIRTNGFDTICHEHLEYYSMTALINLLKRHDLVAFDAEQNDVNGGSFRVYVKHAAAHPLPGSSVGDLIEFERRAGLHEEDVYRMFRAMIAGLRSAVRRTVLEAGETGSVDFYGASTKGNTLIQTFGLDTSLIRYAWERAPQKWGKFTTTGVPIVSEQVGRTKPPALLLVLPWHFRDGILSREERYRREGGRLLFPLPIPQVY